MRVSFKTVPQDTAWAPMRDMWLAADDIDVFSAGWNFDHFYPILQADRTGPCLPFDVSRLEPVALALADALDLSDPPARARG